MIAFTGPVTTSYLGKKPATGVERKKVKDSMKPKPDTIAAARRSIVFMKAVLAAVCGPTFHGLLRIRNRSGDHRYRPAPGREGNVRSPIG